LPIKWVENTQISISLFLFFHNKKKIIFKEKKIDEVAEIVHRVIYDEDLRKSIIESQRKRLEYFKNLDHLKILLGYLEVI